MGGELPCWVSSNICPAAGNRQVPWNLGFRWPLTRPGYHCVEANVMTIDVDAVYENGILTLKHPVDLPENAEVHVTIQTAAEARTPLGRRLRELRAEIARS